MTTSDIGYMPRLDSREDYVDFLEGYALPTVAEAEQQRASRKLVKTYMLETVPRRARSASFEVSEAFPERVRLARLDETLWRLEDLANGGHVVGLLEAIDDRHPVLYTTLDVKESDRFVRQVVDHNPWLDRLWLSSHILFSLWQYVQRTVPGHRYVRLGFEHEAWYESPDAHDEPDAFLDVPDEQLDDDSDDDPSQLRGERRRSRVRLTERLSVLQTKLPELMGLYDPLHSLIQLQMPSGGRGGHLLHYDGKATNRSESFSEHRATIRMVLRLYRHVTEAAEEQLWVDRVDEGVDGFTVSGAPLLIRFQQPLSVGTFERFVILGLQRKTSRFRIGGYLRRLGPTKAHLVAIDRHLWQPFLLEMTAQQLLAVIPSGTCGNTIHRLVTNIQRYLDPDIGVWLGSTPYAEKVEQSFRPAA